MGMNNYDSLHYSRNWYFLVRRPRCTGSGGLGGLETSWAQRLYFSASTDFTDSSLPRDFEKKSVYI